MTEPDRKELAQARREKNKATLSTLVKHYPAFDNYLPLEIGAGEKLLAAAGEIGLSKKSVRTFLHWYTNSNELS